MTSVEAERNQALLAWYGTEGRALPWRETADPYPILVSEVMLQQTQASRVVPRFEAFLARFPDVESLAAAPFADVAAEWSGLGYNTRALRLHQAAKAIAADGWPESVEALEALPGVGGYTARAVAVFAFGHHDVTIDTNLRRVLSRWYGDALTGSTLRRAASTALDDADAAAWNQAVMDLGATVCRPRHPVCGSCPVESWCTGPDVYQPPRAQSGFAGSVRQVRGAIVRELIKGPLDDPALADAMRPFALDDVMEALDGLIGDGVVEETDTGYGLVD